MNPAILLLSSSVRRVFHRSVFLLNTEEVDFSIV